MKTNVHLSHNAVRILNRWNARHGLYSIGAVTETTFEHFMRTAQKLTGRLRPTDSLNLVASSATLGYGSGEFHAGTQETVAVENFLSYLYRDSTGVAPSVSSPFGVDPQRPFDHADVVRLPRNQFEFLLFARAKAIIFGASPQLTTDDVAEAIVRDLVHVSPSGNRYQLDTIELKIKPQRAFLV